MTHLTALEAEMLAALKLCQGALDMLVHPKYPLCSSQAAWAICAAAEVAARSAIEKAGRT